MRDILIAVAGALAVFAAVTFIFDIFQTRGWWAFPWELLIILLGWFYIRKHRKETRPKRPESHHS